MSDSQQQQPLALLLATVVMVSLICSGIVWYRYSRRPPDVQWAYGEEDIANLRRNGPVSADDDGETLEASIREVLQTQQEAWNAGNIDKFMESYWKSEELTFSSGGKVTRGWRATSDNYKKRYSSRSEMGQLDFRDLEISPLGDKAALVLGVWKLKREADDISGNFSLVFRRFDDGWLIVHDHTSSTE